VTTKLLVTGCVAIMSVALVSGQSSQPAKQSKPTSTHQARPQSQPHPPIVTAQSPSDSPDTASQRALIDQYCVACHNARLKTAGLLLDELDLAHLGTIPGLLCARKHVHACRNSEGNCQFCRTPVGSGHSDFECSGRGKHPAERLPREDARGVRIVGREHHGSGLSFWHGAMAESCHR